MHQKVHDCLLSITGASFCHACIRGPIVMDLLGKNYYRFSLEFFNFSFGEKINTAMMKSIAASRDSPKIRNMYVF